MSTTTAIVMYTLMAWTGHDHVLLTDHLVASARACWAQLRIYQSQNPQDHRAMACIAWQQVTVQPND